MAQNSPPTKVNSKLPLTSVGLNLFMGSESLPWHYLENLRYIWSPSDIFEVHQLSKGAVSPLVPDLLRVLCREALCRSADTRGHWKAKKSLTRGCGDEDADRGSLTQDPNSKAYTKRKWPPFADQQGELWVSFWLCADLTLLLFIPLTKSETVWKCLLNLSKQAHRFLYHCLPSNSGSLTRKCWLWPLQSRPT